MAMAMDARQEAAAQRGFDSNRPQAQEHLRVLPASPNWYCSKICDWGYSDALGLLLAFGAKDSIFLYQVRTPPWRYPHMNDSMVPLEGDASESASSSALKQSHKPSITTASNTSSSMRFFAHLKRGKKDQRVTALQFLNNDSNACGSSNANGLQLLCGGEEGSVQVWDVATLKLVAQHRKHGVEVMAVTANPQLDAALVIAGDRQGRISTWKRNEESVTLFTSIAGDGVFSMEMAPHDKALLAVGYRSGVLCIVDALQGVIQYRLQGHDQEVQNVVWRIPSYNSTGVWLASSSRDRTIKVWKLASQEEQEEEPSLAQVLTLPKSKQASSYNQSKRLWLPIAWSYNDNDTDGSTGTQKPRGDQQLRLWSGSFDGNLFAWEWTPSDNSGSENTKTKPQTRKPIVVKNGHSRLLFNIVSLSPSIGLPVGKRVFAPSLLTISLDRELRIWREGKTGAALMCRDKLLGLGGHVYSVAFNPSSQIVASGVGDQTIRLWDVSDAKSAEKKKSLYQAELLWKGLQSKVTSVAWHPFQRSLLGYGTEDGQIGVFDTETKKSARFKSYHSSQVQHLQWRTKPQPRHDEGEARGDTKSSFIQAMLALETAQADGQSLENALKDQEGSFGSSGETKRHELQVLLWSQDAKKQILESNPEKPDVVSKEIKQLGTGGTAAASSCFAWDARGDQLAIGRENGAVEIFATGTTGNAGAEPAEFVSVQKFHEHEQRVVRLSWCEDVLAAGSQDGKIVVFSLVSSSSSPSSSSSSPTEHKSFKKLSPALGTLNQHVVGIFTGHSSAITSLQWNAVGGMDYANEDSGDSTNTKSTLMLASSSNDGSVQVWDLDAQARVSCFRRHFGRVLSVDWIDRFTLVSGGEDQTTRIWDYRDQQPEKQQQKKKADGKSDGSPAHKHIAAKTTTAAAVAAIAHQNGNGSERDTVVSNDATKKLSKPKKKPTKSSTVFHNDEPATLDESLRVCTENLLSSSCSDADEKVHATAFNSSRFAVEEQAYAAEQDWEQLAQVFLLQGKIGDALRVVAREGVLNASWVAFAPMAGLEVWREVTNVYAHQLDTQGDKKNAALHFLSIGKTRAAIKSLVSGHAYNEALTLIQSRLGPHDPLLKQTLLAFGVYLEKRGKYAEAAQMFVKIGTPSVASRAVVLLVKTGEVSAFETALDILASLNRTSTTTADADLDSEDAEGDCSIPSRVFLDIINKALSSGNYSLAERAAQCIGTGSEGSESSVPTKLVCCFLGVVNEFARHLVLPSSAHKSDGDAAPATDLLPSETQELFSYLMRHHKCRYSDQFLLLANVGNFEDSKSSTLSTDHLQRRSKQMWDAMLSVCQANGFWFGASHEENVLEAQELLMDKNYFSYLLALPVSNGATVPGEKQHLCGSLRVIMGVSHCLLQFLLDVICGYLLSGLEHVRDAFEIVSSVDSSSSLASNPFNVRGTCMTFELVSLFFPSGFVDPGALPQIGELTVEAQDTKILWRSFLLYQCRAALAVYAMAREGSEMSSYVLEDLVDKELMSFLSSDGGEEEEGEGDEFNQKLREQVRTELQKLSPQASSVEENASEKLVDGVSVAEVGMSDSLSIQKANDASSSEK